METETQNTADARASQAIHRPGISAATLTSAGIRSTDYPEAGSIEIPFLSIQGQRTGFSRWRLPSVKQDGKKYHQEKGTGVQVYFPPTLPEKCAELVIVEGEFKCLALHDAGIAAIGLPSFGTYTNADERRLLLPGIAEAIKHCKPERILFLGDADTATNYGFSRNAHFLAGSVLPLPVLCPRLPISGPKGIDDLRESLGEGFADNWKDLVQSAEPVNPKSSAGALAVRLLQREANSIEASTGDARDRHRQRVVEMIAECMDALAADDLRVFAEDTFEVSRSAINSAVKDRHRGSEANGSNGARVETVSDRLNSNRPRVELPCGGRLLSDFATELGTILAKHGCYRRGDAAFIVNAKGDKTIALTANYLRTFAEKHLVCFRQNRLNNGGSIQLENTMGEADARGVLSSPQFLAKLPELHRIANIRTPVLRPGQAVELLPAGYDKGTKTLTVETCPFAHDMTIEDAVALLDDVLQDFPWADEGRSKSVALAAMLTTFATSLLPEGALRPVFIYLANREGAGKTICAQLATVAGLGSTETTSAPADNAECRKVLLAAIMESKPALLFDNCRGHLAFGSLEAIATSANYGDRILGKSESFSGPNLLTVILTGNGLTTSPDLRRRALFVELVMQEERSEDRTYKRILDEPALLAMRPKLLAALWAMVRHWNRSGRPKPSRGHGSFPRWAEIIGGIVEAAGYPCCLEAAEIASGGNTDGDDMRRVAERMNGERIDFEGVVAICREIGAFDRLTSGDEPMDKRAKSDLGTILSRYHRTVFAKSKRFIVHGKGRHRRFFTEKQGHGDMGATGSSPVTKAEPIRGNGLNTHVPPCPHVPTIDDADAVLDQPDDVGWTLRERIKAADELLTGSPTKSQIKAHQIGLAMHRDRHQEIVKALARLEGAMT
jgi:hypothetical protein